MTDHLKRVGQRVSDYHLLRWLGGGAFGDVYLAEGIRDHSQVAIKLLQIRLSRGDELKAFINEARTIRLRHAHIVPIWDFGISQDEVPFLVMEYAGQGTLRDRHPKGTQVPLSSVVSYVRQVASALQYAHEQRLIHRDVKPENMLLRTDGTVLLSDFGIASVAHSSHSLNIAEGIGGTLPYMAPEQIQGQARVASDQYSLGIVVYEWVAGKRPFEGTPVEIAMQHAMRQPPSLQLHIPGLSHAVDEVILKALAKNPRDRFLTVQDFAIALEEAVQGISTLFSSDLSGSSFTSFLPPSYLPSPSQEDVKQSQLSADSVQAPSLTTPLVVPPEASLPSSFISPVTESHSFDQPEASHPSSFRTPATEGGSLNQPTPLLFQSRNLQAPLVKRPSLSTSQIRQPFFQNHGRIKAGLLVLLVLLIIGSVSLLYARKNASTVHVNPSVAQLQAIATAKAATSAYNSYVASHGVMLGFDPQHMHVNPYEATLSPTNVSRLVPAWNYSTGNQAAISPAVVNGIVYLLTNDCKISALDAKTGNKQWIVPFSCTAGPAVSWPAVVNGVIYVGSTGGAVYALDAQSGKQIWIYHTTNNSFLSSPAVANGVVYIGSENGTIYALDAKLGNKLWDYNPGVFHDTFYGSPAVANGVVYIGSYFALVYALNAKSGKELWVFNARNVIGASPIVAGGRVYICSTYNGHGTLYSLDAQSGIKLWADAIGSCYAPAIDNGSIYVAGDMFYALNAKSGATLWTLKYPYAEYMNFASPLIANGVIYVGLGNNTLYALDEKSGSKLWSHTVEGIDEGWGDDSPMVANGILYIGGNKLSAFDLPPSSEG